MRLANTASRALARGFSSTKPAISRPVSSAASATPTEPVSTSATPTARSAALATTTPGAVAAAKYTAALTPQQRAAPPLPVLPIVSAASAVMAPAWWPQSWRLPAQTSQGNNNAPSIPGGRRSYSTSSTDAMNANLQDILGDPDCCAQKAADVVNGLMESVDNMPRRPRLGLVLGPSRFRKTLSHI